MNNYAQINESSIVVAISSLSGEVFDENMILIETPNENLLGKTYNIETGEFE